MPIDYLIFLKSGRDFQETGLLYQRAENYKEKYSPSAAIYKFPPAFQLVFYPLAKLPREINQISFIKPLLIGMYGLSLFFLYRLVSRELSLSREESFYFASLLTIISAWFMPFFESIRWLLAEIPILLILISSFILARKGGSASTLSGILMAFIASIKVYPVFMAANLLRERDYAGLAGFFIGLIIILLAALYVFGIDENIFYFTKIFPILISEEVTSKWINLNFEKFLFAVGIIPEVSGTIFSISRVLFLSMFITILYKCRRDLLNKAFLAFSFFITTMFFCFPNYWPQYQIYLIIPIAYLLASYLKKWGGSVWLVMLIMSIVVLFVPDNLWKNTLFIQAPILSLITLVLYEARALATIFLWILLAREILALKNKS